MPRNIERMFETFHQSPNGDFKPTFYNPFEIKHRRRTSKDQFVVLEAAFQENSKPNATVRRNLATRLSMTPRAVQVWFQNRRAKLKGLPGKASPSAQSSGVEVPLSPNPAGDYASSNVSSMASPEPPIGGVPTVIVHGARNGRKALGRRHSMPNMAPMAPPKITTQHFKQLHEAIFGPGSQSPHLASSNGMVPASTLNYQVPISKPMHTPSHPNVTYHPDQAPFYGQPATAPLIMQKRNSVCAPGYAQPQQPLPSQASSQPTFLGYPQMMQQSGTQALFDQSSMLTAGETGNTELDLFLQSMVTPQGHQPSLQQQAFLSNMLAQADPSQLSEGLASFITGSTASASQPIAITDASNDQYLLSKYMNMHDE